MKCWPLEFQAVVDGTKTFEVRLNDRDYEDGDVLLLREWDPAMGDYTGREHRATVVYNLADIRAYWEAEDVEEHGLVALGLAASPGAGETGRRVGFLA